MPYDFTKFPHGSAKRRQLIDSLIGDSDLRETFYLEVKSDFDLSSKAHQAKLAKFILGAANRDARDAMRYLGGYAVLVAGVGDNDVVGVKGDEILDLDKKLSTLIGAEGDRPEWFWEREQYGDKQVLLFFVAPPSGEIFPAVGSSGEVHDGRVYMRTNGQTAEISGAALRNKLRGLVNASTAMDIRMLHFGAAAPLYPDYEMARQQIRRRVDVLRSEAPRPASDSSFPISPRMVFNTDSYGRTPEDFATALAAVERASEGQLRKFALLQSASIMPLLMLEIELMSEKHARDVEIHIELPESVQVVERPTQEQVDAALDNLLPQPWTEPMKHGIHFPPAFATQYLDRNLRLAHLSARRINDHSLVVHAPELRFGKSKILKFDELFLRAESSGSDAQPSAKWRLTAGNLDGQLQGEIAIERGRLL
ncbi:ATP-binding protein [Corynebacterium sp. p3-SID1056]|uniref:ATP-binding protein n=1 Tax=Corynebacterium sp. p3-SID1056 TaxID=2916092 RepID=UPI0021A89FD5|nr:ATP-binding protein [Corynebacterium sp. p3-SID1056]MCT2338228.1 hypothetical protein [Corynebacterium sp. p3-SID1056]